MKKAAPYPSFLPVAAAMVPLLPASLDLRGGFFCGAAVCAAFWAACLFFKFSRALFPRSADIVALVATAAALGQAGRYVFALPEAAAVSFLLLWLMERKVRTRPLDPPPSGFWRGFAFWMTAACTGMIQEILGRQAGWPLFQTPAGGFLILALLAVVWPHTRRARGRWRPDSSVFFGTAEGRLS